MRAAAIALLACACGRVGFGTVAGDGATARRRPISVVTGQAAALVDFPVGVIVASDAALAAGARADGRDLAFSDSDGTTLLSFEIESYDGAIGALVAWVRVPSLASPTTIYLSYGGSSLDLQDPAGTWPGCLGVWHLGDVGSASDSTAHAHVLGPGASQAPATVPGIAGGARSFAVGDSLAIAEPPDHSLDPGTQSYSLSLWVNTTTPAGQFDTPLSKGGGSNPMPGYDVEIGTSSWRTDIGDGTTAVYAMFDTVHGSWVHLVGVADRSAQTLFGYTNATLSDSISIATIGSTDSNLPFQLGDPTDPFVGLLDELRIYDHALSQQWITAEYLNLTNPGAFAALGPEESP